VTASDPKPTLVAFDRSDVLEEKMGAVEIKELKELLSAGRRYLDSSCSLQELNGRAASLADAAKFWRGHASFHQMAAEWITMIDRRWNECGHSPNPLTDEEFNAWLRDQLGNHAS